MMKYRCSRQIVSIELAFRQSPWRAVLTESLFCHSSRKPYWLPKSPSLRFHGDSEVSYSFHYPGRCACLDLGQKCKRWKRRKKKFLFCKRRANIKSHCSHDLATCDRRLSSIPSFFFMMSYILGMNLVPPWWQCWCNSIITSETFQPLKGMSS